MPINMQDLYVQDPGAQQVAEGTGQADAPAATQTFDADAAQADVTEAQAAQTGPVAQADAAQADAANAVASTATFPAP